MKIKTIIGLLGLVAALLCSPLASAAPDAAAAQCMDEQEALAKMMQMKAAEFVQTGAELYRHV